MRFRSPLLRAIPALLLAALLLPAGCQLPGPAANGFPVVRREPPAGAAPHLYAVFAGNSPTWATNPEALAAITANFDAAEVMIDADSWFFEGQPLTDYLAGQGVSVYSYLPAYFAWAEPASRENHAHAWELRELVRDDWWLRDAGGQIVEPWPGLYLLNFSQPGLVSAYGDFLAGLDRPIRFDVLDGNLHYNGSHVDLDRNGADDVDEHGLAWIDRQMAEGFIEALKRLDQPATGNGSWMPAGEGRPAYFEGHLQGFMVEDFPAATWRDPERGWQPAPEEAIDWHLREALRRPGFSIFLPLGQPSSHSFWGRYVADDWHAIRLALAAALLTDGYLGLGSVQMPGWCDECGVVDGRTTRDPGAGNWLGPPLGPAEAQDGLWRRAFAHGEVWLNATGQDRRVSVPPGLEQIAGWYDTAYNAGGAWDGRLPPYEARLLWRVPSS